MFHVHNIFMIVVFVKLQYLLKAVGRGKLWLRQCPWWNFLTRQQKRNAMTESGVVVCLLLATTTKISPSITKQLLKKDWKVSQLVNFMQVFLKFLKGKLKRHWQWITFSQKAQTFWNRCTSAETKHPGSLQTSSDLLFCGMTLFKTFQMEPDKLLDFSHE